MFEFCLKKIRKEKFKIIYGKQYCTSCKSTISRDKNSTFLMYSIFLNHYNFKERFFPSFNEFTEKQKIKKI
jgi:hypothetical protein